MAKLLASTKLISANFGGNLHSLSDHLNKLELSDFVLHMESNGHNCIVVFRVPRTHAILVEKKLMLRSS